MTPRERQVEIQKTTMHVVDSVRRGPLAMVAVHGFPGGDLMTLCGTAGFDSLDPRTRLVFYDQRGAGRSGGWPPDSKPSIARHGDDLRQLIAALSLSRPIVIGHGAGCTIGMQLALEHPAVLSGLVLVCPRLPQHGEARRLFEEKVAEMLDGVDPGALLGRADHEPDVALRKAMAEIFPLGFLRFGLAERTFMQRLTFRRQAYDDLWTALAGWELADRVQELRIPVLVLAGRYDPFIDLAAARELADAVPGARLALLHNAAHWPFLEEPERFADELWSWTEEVAAHIL